MTVQERLKHFLENSGFSSYLIANIPIYSDKNNRFASDGTTFLNRWREGNGCYFEYNTEYNYLRMIHHSLCINIL